MGAEPEWSWVWVPDRLCGECGDPARSVPPRERPAAAFRAMRPEVAAAWASVTDPALLRLRPR